MPPPDRIVTLPTAASAPDATAKARALLKRVLAVPNTALIVILGGTRPAIVCAEKVEGLFKANAALDQVRGLVVPDLRVLEAAQTTAWVQAETVSLTLTFVREVSVRLNATASQKSWSLMSAMLKALAGETR